MVIKFDLGPLPPNVEVLEATFSLYSVYDYYPLYINISAIFRVTRPWSEKYASWMQADSGVLWTHPGGDYLPDTAAKLVRTLPNVAGSWENFDVTSLIRTLAQNPDSNHGMLIAEGYEEAHDYLSSECADTALRPKLSITYATVAAEAAVKIPHASLKVAYASNGVFRISLPGPGPFELGVYDILGRTLWTCAGAERGPGSYRIVWPDRTQIGRQAGLVILRQGGLKTGRPFTLE